MKKRLFAIMLALAMVLVMASALAEEGKGAEALETAPKITCNVCKKEVESVDANGLCEECALSLKEEAAKKAAEEEAAKKAAEEAKSVADEAANKAAEEEAAKKAAEEEAAKKAAEEAAKKAAEGTTQNPQTTTGETNQAGTGMANECHHEHTAAWASKQTNVQGTMVEHPAVAATCITEGNVKYYTCTNCGEYFLRDENTKDKIVATKTSADKVKISKKDHTLTKVYGKPATCTETGIKEHYECSVCGKLFSDSEGKNEIADATISALGHDYEYNWGTWDCKTKMITASRRCKRTRCTAAEEEPTTISVSEKSRDTWYSCGKKYTTVYYNVAAAYGAETVNYNGKAECTSSTYDYCRPGWYYDDCYYRNTCGHWGCGDVCTRYSSCIPCRNYRTAFRTGGYSCLATPKTGDASTMAPAILALLGAAGAMLGKKRR